MIRFPNAGDAVKRLTGIVPATSDYTAIFYWQYSITSGDRVPWIILDAPGTYLDWIQFFSSGDFLTLSIGLGGVDHSSISQATEQDVLYPVAYVREGNEHRFYWNGGLVDTITLDISTATLGETWLGDDSFANEGDQDFYNFREWSRALTEPELYAEFTSEAVVGTTLLVTNTPLLTDLLDDSGNGNDWTAVGANSFVGTPPIYSTRFSAYDLGIATTAGVSVVLNPESSNHDRRYEIWARFYAAPAVIVSGAFGWSSSAQYNPRIQVYNQSLTPIIDPVSDFPRRVPVEFPTIAGEVYYLRFQPASATAGLGSSTLELNVLGHAESVAPLSSFFINDTGAPDLTAILSSITNYLVHEFLLHVVHGEGGDTTETGISLLEDASTGELVLYSSDWTELIRYTKTIAVDLRIRTNWSTQKIWYALDTNPVVIGSIDPVSQVDGDPFTLTGITTANGIAVDPTESVAYITGTGTGDAIKRWDLVNDVIMSDFVAGITGYIAYDIIPLPDNTVLVLYYKPTATKDLMVKRFNEVGVVANTYTFGSDFIITKNSIDFGPPRITWGVNVGSSFWIMIHPDDPNFPKIIFRETDISTGSQIGTDVLGAFYNSGIYGFGKASPQQANPFARFGPNSSCPFFLTRSSTLPPAATLSGIYQIVPNKTNDTVFTDVGAGITLVRKIPDPFARSGALGD